MIKLDPVKGCLRTLKGDQANRSSTTKDHKCLGESMWKGVSLSRSRERWMRDQKRVQDSPLKGG